MKRLCRRRGVWKYMGGLALCAACALFLALGFGGKAARTGTVSVESARVRESASTDAELVGSLASGDTVDVLDETESGGRIWYQVQYTQDGEQITGWLREDLLTVTGTDEEPEDSEGEEAPEETGEPEAPAAAFTIQEPAEAPAADYLTQTSVQVGETSYTAWQADADSAVYLVWASAADGSAGWYWYDPAQNTFQQDLGQFGSEGLVTALQNELTTLKESSAKGLSLRLYIIIGLAVLSVVLLVLVIVFAVKLRNADYEYEYDDDDDDDYDDDEGEDGYEEEKPKKKGLFGRGRNAEEDDEGDDFDDFMEAVKKKRSEDASASDDEEEPEEDEKVDLTLTANLPEIDMSAVEEVEKKAEKTAPKPAKEAEADDDEDFDIEILDLDDLNL